MRNHSYATFAYLKDKDLGGLDSVVDNALACHHGDPGSNPGQGMWQGSGRPSRFGGFPRVLRFPPPRLTT